MGLTVYILLCADGTYYTGVTRDAEKRFREHCIGIHEDSYTYNRRPLELVWFNHFGSNMEAIAWEKKIKGWSKKKKEALIRGEFELLPELSQCKNKSHYKFFDKESKG